MTRRTKRGSAAPWPTRAARDAPAADAADASTDTQLAVPPAPQSSAVPYLYVVLEAARPSGGSARLRIDDVDEIAIGRGKERDFLVRDRRITLAIPDRRMSALHAVLVRSGGGWELVDQDSKNGCRVDGVGAKRATLRDGAWLDIGQTVLRLRAGPRAEDRWLDAEHVKPVVGVATVVPSFAAQLDALVRLAPSRVTLLVTGATGTGKEMIARGIHAVSGRRGPFVAVNCAALTKDLVESQLFGHRKGAFSGAIADHDGLVRAAEGGTLLLDEVGDLPLPAQAALLRVLQEREVMPVGDTKPIAVDVRVIAATHRELSFLVASGEFRADLFARLAGHVETLPPLAARREDIGTIVASALQRHGGARAADTRLTLEAARYLVTAAWPHNIRELDKALEAALALAGDQPIDVVHLPKQAAHEPGDTELRERLVALLAEHRGNISQVARDLGKARMQVQRWLKRFALDPDAYR
jgi:transcriptional regulator with GAF, ATPase, and Fis domain